MLQRGDYAREIFYFVVVHASPFPLQSRHEYLIREISDGGYAALRSLVETQAVEQPFRRTSSRGGERRVKHTQQHLPF